MAAFGAAGQIVRRLPPRFGRLAAPAGCLLLAGAYMALSASLFAGRHPEALLVVLLAAGGLGLGTQFSALIVHLTNAVSERHVHDISGVTTTTTTIAGAIAIAASRHRVSEPRLRRCGDARLRGGDRRVRGDRDTRGGAGPRGHAPACQVTTTFELRPPRARRRRARVTRMPSSETASVIFDSPAMRSLKTNGTSSMRLPMR